jgi:hypothetical protein
VAEQDPRRSKNIHTSGIRLPGLTAYYEQVTIARALKIIDLVDDPMKQNKNAICTDDTSHSQTQEFWKSRPRH